MSKYKISNAMRLLFFAVGSVIWVGIWLTGFSTVHWLLYVPAALLILAAATGICPGMIFSNMICGSKEEKSETGNT